MLLLTAGLDGWQKALDNLPDGKAVEIDTLTEAFPGIDGNGGTFRAHLELAALAIALKRRVIVLQAMEHAQSDPGSLFENFARALKADQHRLDKTGVKHRRRPRASVDA